MCSVVSVILLGGGPMRPLPTMHWTSLYRDTPSTLPLPRNSLYRQPLTHCTGIPPPQTVQICSLCTFAWLTSYWNAFLLPPANEVAGRLCFTGVCGSAYRGMVSQHALQVSRPTPRGKLRGLAWGEGGLQAHTLGGS